MDTLPDMIVRTSCWRPPRHGLSGDAGDKPFCLQAPPLLPLRPLSFPGSHDGFMFFVFVLFCFVFGFVGFGLRCAVQVSVDFGAAYDRVPHPDVGMEESVAEVRMQCCFLVWVGVGRCHLTWNYSIMEICLNYGMTDIILFLISSKESCLIVIFLVKLISDSFYCKLLREKVKNVESELWGENVKGKVCKVLRYEYYEPILPNSLPFSTLLLVPLPPVLFDLPAADSLKLPTSLLLDPPYSPPISYNAFK